MTLLLSVLFGLLSMVSYGFANTYSKPLSQQLGPARTVFLRGLSVCLFLGLSSVPSFHHFQHHWGVAMLTIGLGVAGYIPVLAFTYGVRESRLGVVAPIAATAPLITVLLSFMFLDVRVNSFQWLAIAMVVTVNVFVCVDFTNFRDSNLLRFSSGVPFALIAAAGWGLFYFLLVPSTRALDPWLSAFLIEVGVTVAAGLHVRLANRHVGLADSLRRPVILNALFICMGTVAFTVGVRHYNVGIVAALSNSGALITAALGALLFKEHLQAKEKIAAAVMISGVGIIPFVSS